MIISDIGLPEMNGYEFMQQVRSRPADQGGQTPAIALTAYVSDIDAQAALNAGFQRYLAKPISIPKLLQAVQALVQV